jgi:hypothetical protein
MIDDICCCTIIFVIAVIIFFRVFGRAIIVRQSQQQTARPPPFQTSPNQNAPGVINMIKCSHCGRVHDETLPGCPGCGGKTA